MSVNQRYMKMPLDQRADIMRAIGTTFENIDKIKYPAIYENIQDDEARVAVMEIIIGEMFGSLSNLSLEEALNITEITISDN